MRQYIGARYVPKFMGTYDATQAYEALCVVDNGMGTSYISTVPTPANTPLTDTNYWAIYGASSGAIINLQNQIDAINTTMGSNPLNTTDQTITGAINELLADVDSIDVGDEFKHAKMILLADSYGSRLSTSNQLLLDAIADRMGLSATDYNAFQAGGIGFTNHGGNGTFLSLLQQSTVTLDPNEVTHILVLGGTNDHDETPATIFSGITSFITYCNTTYPKAKIMIGFDGAPRFSKTRLDEAKATANVYKFCMTRDAYYLWGVENALHSDDYLEADRVHPNASGVDRLVLASCGAMRTGLWKNNEAVTAVPTFNSSNANYSAGSVTGTLNFELDNDTVYFKPSYGWLSLTLATPGTIGTGRQKLFTLTKKLIMGNATPDYRCSASVIVKDSSNNIIDKAPCILYIDEDGDLSSIISINDFNTLTGAASITINLLEGFSAPALGC